MWTHTRIRTELRDRAKAHAAKSGLSLSAFIEQTLESALGGRAIEDASVGHALASTDRAGSLPASSPAPTQAPVEKPASPALLKCPVARCDFRAKSPAAKCGMHGRTVVPG